MNDGTSGGVCFVLFCFVLLLGAGIIQLQVIVRQLTITTRVNRCLQCRCAYDCAFMKLGVCFRIDSDVTSGQSTDLVPSISLKEAYTLLKSQEGRTPKFCQNPLLLWIGVVDLQRSIAGSRLRLEVKSQARKSLASDGLTRQWAKSLALRELLVLVCPNELDEEFAHQW